ncbi:hypothetical protein BGI41_05540 [Methanobrevibacter sp. 87.7]|uniref:DUF1786 domain-containing protein n=1 Tax=Methanobrevibacter sp. 87.7 TaxID=387957 RepID=UPI000B510212|nr:DUF1786 domain-containing protein [Methanobrevibacter sp. 87.7]OWT32837.1 hypothetical protein BGI41_05540 [Methanobrevibacter sp. 87.7]
MKTLAIDIGTGTQDIIYYDNEKEIENSIKLVLPSPHLLIAQKIRNTENNIYFYGEIMGGGKLKNAILEHMEKGYDVVMEKHCAKTIRDNLSQVESYGIKTVNKEDIDKYKDYTKIKLTDIDIDKLSNFLKEYDLNFKFDNIAVAVQDHGYNKDMGDRNFRFEKIREKLNKPLKPEEFGWYGNIPEYYSRMKSVENTLKNKTNIEIKNTALIMDTKFASICGMCHDDESKKLNSYIVTDIGNGHTTTASIENGKIQGIFEHHTRNLTEESLEKYIKKLANGTLTNEEIYNDHGHGAHILNPIKEIEKVIVTGPKRGLIENTNLDYHEACPGGDVMMTGTIGLIKSLEYQLNNKN